MGVNHRWREGRCSSGPVPQPPPHVRRGQPSAGLGDKQRPLRIAALDQRRPAASQVALQRLARVLPDGTSRIFFPFPWTRTVSESKSSESRSSDTELMSPQPGGVGQLEQRSIAELKRRSAGIRSSRAATSAGLSTLGSRRGLRGECSSSAGLSRRLPLSIRTRNSERSAASLRVIVRRRVSPLSQHGQVTPEVSDGNRGRARSPRALAQRANCPASVSKRHACAAPRPAHEILVERVERRAPLRSRHQLHAIRRTAADACRRGRLDES